MAFPNGWGKFIPFTVNKAFITGSLTNFPGHLNLALADTDTRAAIAARANADGSDIRITLADGTLTPYYLRPGTYSNAGGLASGIIDPLYPSLTSGVDGAFRCYYQNPSTSDASNAAAVFGSAGAGFAGAWGFGDGVTLDLTDLTGNGNNGTNNGATAGTGILGGGANFNGTAYIAVGDLSSPSAGSVSLWIAPNSSPGYGVWSSTDNFVIFFWNALTTLYFRAGGSGSQIAANIAWTAGQWHHVAMAWSGSGTTFQAYIDGVQVGTETQGASGTGTDSLGVFATTYKFSGLMDEPCNIPFAIPPAWPYLATKQITEQASVVTWGAEQSTTTPMSTLTIQRGTNGTVADTMFNVGEPTFNFGATNVLQSGGNPGVNLPMRGLLSFDLSGLPAGATIIAAVLSLYCESEASTTDYAVGVHRALTQWWEGTKDEAAPGGGENASTWNLRNANGSVAWAGGAGGGSGSDWTATATDSKTITAPSAWYDYNVLADVQAWYGGATNYGWWIINPSENINNSRKRFTSSEGATVGNRPKLVVTYSTITPNKRLIRPLIRPFLHRIGARS